MPPRQQVFSADFLAKLKITAKVIGIFAGACILPSYIVSEYVKPSPEVCARIEEMRRERLGNAPYANRDKFHADYEEVLRRNAKSSLPAWDVRGLNDPDLPK